MADQASKLPVLDGADGTDGSSAPSITIQVGGKDGSGNLQTILTDTSGNVGTLLKDSSANGITSTTINSKQRLDVDLSSEAADGATAPFSTVQIGGKDPNGNLQAFITVTSGEQFTRDVINVSSQYRAQSVTTTAAQALGASTILVNRKTISITPTNGTVYWATNSSVTTTTGTPLFAFQTLVLSFTDNVQVWLISAGTVDTRILEAS